ncbi:hypothetical protein, partial [Aeromonas caviae]|uniref:hypothetical protein n=1 Tax=Aeromonas caviae TaxID=648 RepID=UPI00403918CD
MDAIPNADVHVVRNGHFGEEKKFELYNGSKLRTVANGQFLECYRNAHALAVNVIAHTVGHVRECHR